jgi:hypothetical protein
LLAIFRILVREGYDIVSSCLYEDSIKEIWENCKDAICLGITSMTGNQILEGLRVAILVKKKYPEPPYRLGQLASYSGTRSDS